MHLWGVPPADALAQLVQRLWTWLGAERPGNGQMGASVLMGTAAPWEPQALGTLHMVDFCC